MKVYDLIKKVLERGDFSLSAMEEKIEKSWLEDNLSDEEKHELLDLAYSKVNENAQVDVLALAHELQERLARIEAKLFVEHSDYEVWVRNMSVAKGQTVLADVDGDGIYDFCLYDGGRDYTALSIGKIDGWFKTDVDGNKTHIITRDGSDYVLTPIVTEPTEEETEE